MVVTKKVRVLYTVEVIIDVPHDWTPDQIVASEADGGWQYNVAEWGSAEFVKVTAAYVGTDDDYPQRRLKGEQE